MTDNDHSTGDQISDEQLAELIGIVSCDRASPIDSLALLEALRELQAARASKKTRAIEAAARAWTLEDSWTIEGNEFRVYLCQINEVVWRFEVREPRHFHDKSPSDELVMVYGTVKWDGCSDISTGDQCMWHGCDPDTFKVLANALERAYWACARALGDKWDREDPPPKPTAAKEGDDS